MRGWGMQSSLMLQFIHSQLKFGAAFNLKATAYVIQIGQKKKVRDPLISAHAFGALATKIASAHLTLNAQILFASRNQPIILKLSFL